MRKNIYDNNIIMFSYYELINVASSRYISEQEQNLVWSCLHNNISDELRENYEKEGIGIKSDDQIIDIAKQVRKKIDYPFCNKNLKNAFLYSIMYDEFPNLRETIRTCPRNITEKTFVYIYGEEVYNYIETHKNYSYEDDYDPVILDDLNIYLYEDKKLNKYSIADEHVLKKQCVK